MRHRRVDHLRLAGGGAVAEAVVRRAEMRAALDHPTWDVLAGLARVVARFGRGDARVGRDAARAHDLVRMARDVPVGRPLPDVPGDVVEPVPVRREAAYRGRPLVPVELRVLPGKLALPAVRHCLPVGEVLVSPGERGTVEPAARGKLPFGLGRKLLARPTGVRIGVLVGDVRDGVVVAAVDRRALAARLLPVRPGDVRPPVAVVVEVDRASRRLEDQRARNEQVRVGIRIVVRDERPFGHRDVPRLAREAAELGRRDGPLVHPEAVDRDAVHRPLLRVEVLGAHRERAAGNPRHARRARRGDGLRSFGDRAHAAYCLAIAIRSRSSGPIR
jgi:hypothetical protein